MSIEVMKQWLECVERCDAIDGVYSWSGVVDSLRKAIEQAEQDHTEQHLEMVEKQEPCDMGEMCLGCSPCNADGSCPDRTPPQRQWIGLTNEEKEGFALDIAARCVPTFEAICEAEARLKERNT